MSQTNRHVKNKLESCRLKINKSNMIRNAKVIELTWPDKEFDIDLKVFLRLLY